LKTTRVRNPIITLKHYEKKRRYDSLEISGFGKADLFLGAKGYAHISASIYNRQSLWHRSISQ